MTGCNHPSALRIAAEALRKDGVLRTFEAVYRWTCPDCGMPRRTTRLADTIYALRHAYGWVIETHPESEQLAVYTLVKAGDMPGDPSKGPHPRQLVRDQELRRDPVNSEFLGSRVGYKPYIGQRVPVDAIPSPTVWECVNCKQLVHDKVGQPQLGGYRRGVCPGCSYSKTTGKNTERILRPVVR